MVSVVELGEMVSVQSERCWLMVPRLAVTPFRAVGVQQRWEAPIDRSMQPP